MPHGPVSPQAPIRRLARRVAQPTEKELKVVIAIAGSLARRQTSEEEEMVQAIIQEYRREKRPRPR